MEQVCRLLLSGNHTEQCLSHSALLAAESQGSCAVLYTFAMSVVSLTFLVQLANSYSFFWELNAYYASSSKIHSLAPFYNFSHGNLFDIIIAVILHYLIYASHDKIVVCMHVYLFVTTLLACDPCDTDTTFLFIVFFLLQGTITYI